MAGMDESNGVDEVDREDPLLITTVKARLNREEKVKKVGRKTVKRLVNIKGDDDDKPSDDQPSVVNPRRYQQEAFNTALRKNTILYLETGGGKTLVAVLLIKALAKSTRVENVDKRLIVFLAPTVILVQQQSRVVKIHTDLKVGEYYGAKNVDSWGSAEWATQISGVQVMLMTPQVLLNNLQHGYMKMDTIELLIFDECHHAYKNHAYAQIMKGFYHVNAGNGRLPKIFGMTASPVTKKGVKTLSEAAGQLSGLEDMLKSEVFTLKDREEVEFVAPTACTIEEHYDAPNLELVASLKERIEALLNKCERANVDALTNLKVGFKDVAELIERLRDKIHKFHRDLQFSLEELGLWCAYKVAEHSLKVDIGVNDFEGFGDATQVFKRNKDLFMKESLQVLQSAVPEGWATIRTAQELQDAVSQGYLTPKVYLLVKILSQKRLATKDVKCMIFVERRVAAVVISSLVNQLPCLSEFLLARAICGANAGVDITRGQQRSIVDAFNQGEINLLVTTDIAEEGLDVQTCSEVIRFDLPKSLRSNIQSRGRARQQGSTYIVFLERGNVTQKEQFSRILRSEPVMREEVLSREHMPANSNWIVSASPETYRVPSTGASVTPDSSVNLILRFCGKLPSDKFYMPKPEYVFEEVGSQHKCKLKLPPASPIHEVQGEPQSTPHLAKNLTALEACKQLHKIGALNDNLVPSFDFELGDEEEKFSKLKNASGVGTTIQKELYPSEEVKVLTGCWYSRSSDVLLFAYCMSFDLQPKENKAHANFVLLTGSALEDDVAKLETDLCLNQGRRVTVKLSPQGSTFFSADQLSDAKLFQTVLFNGMFSKMSKSGPVCRKRKRGPDVSSLFLDRTDLWNPNNAYLILPAVTSNLGTGPPIDWNSIHSTSSALKKLAFEEDQGFELCPPRKKHSLFKTFTQLFTHRQVQQQPSRERFVTLAGNCEVPQSQLEDAAVLTLHTMMIYPVVSVLQDTTAQSPFPFPGEANLKSYAEFFKSKYWLTLQFSSQPLLQLKQIHRAHNLLPTCAGNREKAAGNVPKVEKPQKEGKGGSTVPNAPGAQSGSLEMPPELCLVLGFSAAVIRSAYWVPSAMHRLKAAALACQLRQSIRAPRIPVMEVLKALTTTRCNENFNMEALELFGDSFLKYAVTRKLFLELKVANEGVLSMKRMHRICNRTLHQLAVKRGLPGYIRDCPFDPSRWAAPGMLVSRRVTCRCKEEQMFKAFKSTASKVLGVFGNGILTEQVRADTIKPRIGLTCDKGHRYLCSKTVADVMEALIGAYLDFGRNCEGALKFMVWAGIDVDYDPALMEDASTESPVDLSFDYGVDVKALENRIGYIFKNKYLLLEAMTHPSNMGGDRVRCYQRLEFLGDAVLDFLLTRHLFTSHPTSSPGLLTSLRSASVNNERFARVAVKNKLHCYLRHGSGLLLHQIEEFVKSVEAAGDDQRRSSFGLQGLEAPKALGDLLESIAGAIAIDTCFDLDKVWAVMKPLLEPIVTPATLDMHPVTELEELCSGAAYNLKCYDQNSKDGGVSTIRYEVQITEDLCIDGTSSQPKKKIAKKHAAAKVLAKLKTPGSKEKFGKPIVKFEPKLETNEALSNLPIAQELQELPAKKPELCTKDSETRGENLVQIGGEALTVEIIHPRRHLVPSEVRADLEQLFPEDKGEPDPCTKAKQFDEVPQDKKVEIVKVSKVGLIRSPDHAKEIMCPTTVKPSVHFESCAKNVLHSNIRIRTVNGNVQEYANETVKVTQQREAVKVTQQREVVKVTEQREGENVVEISVPATKLVQGNGIEVVPKTKEFPFPAITVSANDFSGDRDLKREATSGGSHDSRPTKSAKFSWSQDMVVQTAGTNSTELHSSKSKPVDEALDLLNFCPWTQAFPSESFVQGRSPSTKSIKGTVDVRLPGKGLFPSPPSARKPTLSTIPAAQGTKSSPSQAASNCRQILNEIRMKNRWSNPVFKLMNEEDTSHVPRFRFSLTVDTGKQKYECHGEAKPDKKQGMESVASIMLTILKQKGVAAHGYLMGAHV